MRPLKTCDKCGEEKVEGAFYRIRDGVLSPTCRACTNRKRERARARKSESIAREVTRALRVRVARLEALPHAIPNDCREPLEAEARELLRIAHSKRVQQAGETLTQLIG